MSDHYRDTVENLFAALGTSTGRCMLEHSVAQLALLGPADFATVAVLAGKPRDRLVTVATCIDGKISDDIIWPLADSPAAEVIDDATACSFRSGIQEKFPHDRVLHRLDMHSYLGVPLFARGGELCGAVILMSRRSLDDDLFVIDIIRLIADRLVAEIERLHGEPGAGLPRPQTEARLRSCENELRNARKELESFTYAVAHDLRGPLRAVSGFSETLELEYGDRLDAQARDYLQRIRSNAQRMDRKIAVLSSLSRISRHQMHLSQVDLSRICEHTLARLRKRDPARHVVSRIQADIRVAGDYELLSAALEQLLDNAWKFTRDTGQAEISLSAEYRNGETLCRLRDNGAGFDMRYADRLFEIFQRLHGHQAFEGDGVGLAMVRRIIEKHGGTIDAHSAPDDGTTIEFTLPAQTASGVSTRADAASESPHTG
jgi:signal transduction histidine kinase